MTGVDAAADRVTAELAPIPRDLPPTRRLCGKVIDNEGNPVFGAVVSISGAMDKERIWVGNVDNVDKAAVTAADGTFLLTSTQDYGGWNLTINATGFVPLKTSLYKTGDTQHEIELDPGSSVAGLVTKNGRPAAGVTIGICQSKRETGTFVGEYIIATDEQGRFLFTSVVLNNQMTVYSKMEEGNAFTMEIAEFTTGKSGSTSELGEFEMKPAKTLTGKIWLPGGKSLPKNFRIGVGREFAWDTQIIDVDTNGYFKIDGVPLNEAVRVGVRVPGYAIDSSKTNLQTTGESSVAFFTDNDLNHIEIFLKPVID